MNVRSTVTLANIIVTIMWDLILVVADPGINYTQTKDHALVSSITF